MSADFLQPLLDWIAHHPGWAGLAVFLIAFSESLAIVGLFMPGVMLMFGIGTLIATGVMPFWPSLWLSVAGAIAGDGLSFWLGYHYKDQLRGYWPFNRYPELFSQGERFFLKHGGKSILFGRFVGPVRPIVPVTAGMLGMGPWKFVSVNVASALAWAPAYLLPGMVFGASLGLAAEVASRLAVLVVLLIAIPWLGLWLVRKIYQRLAPHAEALTDRLVDWGRQHRHLGQVTAALVDPQQPEAKGLTIVAVGLVVLALAIVSLFQQFSVTPPLARLDNSLYHLLQELRTPWGDHLMVITSQLGDGLIHAAVIGLLLLWLLIRRHWLAAGHWLALGSFAFLATLFIKQTLALPRPAGVYEGIMGYGFPSAHTVFATCTYGFLAVLVARELPQRWRWLSYAAATLIVLGIAFSRLYLGAHWLSDIVGGLLLGTAWVMVLGVAFRRHISAPLPLRGLVGLPLAALIVIGGWHVFESHERQIELYGQRHQTRTMSLAEWRNDGWRQLPAQRVDTLGDETQPLNLQLAGNWSSLEHLLANRGWQLPRPLNAMTALQWLNPEATLAQTPLLPHVHDGRHPYLTMIQPEQQLVLRLWPADIQLTDTGQQLWIGYVGRLGLKSFTLFAVPNLQNDFDGAVRQLLKDVAPLVLRSKARQLAMPQPGWEGVTLLLQTNGEN